MANNENIGIKHDENKLRYDLLPINAIEGVVKILTYGAKKYKPNGWLEVRPIDRYYAAAMRHLMEERKGIKNDVESGLLHIDHAITSLIMYRELKERESGAGNINSRSKRNR